MWHGGLAAFDGLRHLVFGAHAAPLYVGGTRDARVVAAHNIVDFAFLPIALLATWVALRRLPLAYGAFALCTLLFAISYPVAAEPLMSLPRFLIVIFPLAMATAMWALERRWLRPLLILSGFWLFVFSAQFATWIWVA
jgi:hypothetical protein